MLLPKRFILIDDHELMLLGIRLALQTSEPNGIPKVAADESAPWNYPENNIASIEVMLLDISNPKIKVERHQDKFAIANPEISIIIYSLNEVLNSFDHSIAEKTSVIIKKGTSADVFMVSLTAQLCTDTLSDSQKPIASMFRSAATNDHPQLTGREKEVLYLMRKETAGTENTAILNFSKQTVCVQRPRRQPKFDTQTTLGLIMDTLGIGVFKRKSSPSLKSYQRQKLREPV